MLTPFFVGAALAGVGMEETEGLVVGCGPATVGASVGAELTHLSVLMPKHCSPALEQVPDGQASAVKQFASATSYVSPQ